MREVTLFDWLLGLSSLRYFLLLIFVLIIYLGSSLMIAGEPAVLFRVTGSLLSMLFPIFYLGYPYAAAKRLNQGEAKPEVGTIKLLDLSFVSILVVSFFTSVLDVDMNAGGNEIGGLTELVKSCVSIWMVLSVFFLMWTAARLLVSKELGRPAKTSEIFLTSLGFVYFPLVIYYLKKRLDRYVSV